MSKAFCLLQKEQTFHIIREKEGTSVRINILKILKHGQSADMIYMKNNGEITKRRVRVLSVTEDSFQAYCFLRGTKRTFKIDNILAFVPVIHKERTVI